MVDGHNGDSGLTVQLLVTLGIKFVDERAQILLRNKMENRVMVQMWIPRTVYCHTALV